MADPEAGASGPPTDLDAGISGSSADVRLVLPAVLAWLAALLAPRLGVAWAAGLAAAHLLAAIGLGACLVRGRPAGRAPLLATSAVATAVLAVVLGRVAIADRAAQAGALPQLSRARAQVEFEAVVTGDPRAVAGRVVGAVRGQDLYVVPVRVIWVAGPDGSHRRSDQAAAVLATAPGWSVLAPSQQVHGRGRATPPSGTGQEVAALSVRAPPDLVGRPSLLQQTATALRAGLRTAAHRAGAADGLLPGMVDGDTSDLPAGVKADFRAAGMTHLVAVSGANVAITLAVTLGLTRRMRARRWVQVLLASAVLAGFVVLARPSPSVLRAAGTGAIAIAGVALSRRRSGLSSLCAAIVVLLCWQPGLGSQLGFALSVLATAGLLILAPGWSRSLAKCLPAAAASALAVPLAALAACTPVVAMQWGIVSPAALPANLLAAPAVAPVTVLGTLAAALAPVSGSAAHLVALLAGVPCWWLRSVAQVGAHSPGGVLRWPDGLVGGIAALAAVLGVRWGLGHRPARRLLASGSATALLASAVVVPVLSPVWPPPGWQMAVCDVGQGDAIVLRGPPELGDVLFDTGPDPAKLTSCLHDLGTTRIALIVLTHLHADHVEGLPAVLGHLPVLDVERGPLLEPVGEWQRVQRWVAAAGVPMHEAVVGERRQLGAVSWQVLGPLHAFHGTDSDPNNSSLVVRAQVGSFSVLLSGDAEDVAQRELEAPQADRLSPPLAVDVLKVPHHGSARSDPEFLAASRARIAVTSVGAGNPYGHPAASTLAALERQGATLLRTDLDGSVALLSQGGTVVAVPHRSRSGPELPRAAGGPDPPSPGPPVVAPGLIPAAFQTPWRGLPADWWCS